MEPLIILTAIPFAAVAFGVWFLRRIKRYDLPICLYCERRLTPRKEILFYEQIADEEVPYDEFVYFSLCEDCYRKEGVGNDA